MSADVLMCILTYKDCVIFKYLYKIFFSYNILYILSPVTYCVNICIYSVHKTIRLTLNATV